MKIEEANRVTRKDEKVLVDGDEVIKSIEKAFRQSVKPTWALWEKQMKIRTRGSRSTEKRETPSV